jgi:alkylation response protein AidB-like acyl-CoA dehydrogenase
MSEAVELLVRVKELHLLLANNAAAGERDRCVAEESIDALTRAGVFKLTVPKRYGGYQTWMRTMLDVSAAIAAADGGTAWIVALINVYNWLTGLFSEKAQDEVFGADPRARVSGVLAPTSQCRRTKGGWRVTGKWYDNAGSLHSTWSVLGVPITNVGGEVVDQGLALIPSTDLEVEDTWFVAGMKSTGSNAVTADDIFVPEHRILRVLDAIGGEYSSEYTGTESLYRSAFIPVLALSLIGPQLGMGAAALDHVISEAAEKPISYTYYEAQRDSVAFQLQIAEAARLIDTAHLHAYRAANDIDEAAARGVYPDFLTRARIRSDTGHVAESITRAIDILLSAHGSGSFAEANPLQRIWRDSSTAARHAVSTPMVGYEVYGKALLSVEDSITPFV